MGVAKWNMARSGSDRSTEGPVGNFGDGACVVIVIAVGVSHFAVRVSSQFQAGVGRIVVVG
jgi:hypothetical protein